MATTVVAVIGVGVFGYPKLASYLEESAWIEDLASSDVELRKKAIEALAEHRSRRAVDPLLACVSNDAECALEAALALCRIGEARAVDDVAYHAGKLPKESRRRWLSAFCDAPKNHGVAEVIYALGMQVEESRDSQEVLAEAASALQESGVDYVARLLAELPAPNERGEFGNRYGELYQENPKERVTAALKFLGAFGVNALPAADRVIELLVRSHPEAGKTLGKMGAAVMPRLLKAFRDDLPFGARWGFVAAIGEMKQEGKAGLPILRRLLTDPEAGLGGIVLTSIHQMKVRDQDTADAILSAIPTSTSRPGTAIRPGLLVIAFEVLLQVAPQRQRLIPSLLRWLEEPDISLSTAAFSAITKISPGDEALLEPIERALARWGPASPALPRIVRGMKQCGLSSESMVQFLRQAKEEHPDLKEIWSVLVEIKARGAFFVIGELEKGSGDLTAEDVRRLAARVGPSFLARLLPRLDHSNVRLRRGLCRVLGELGPSVKDALPSLTKRLSDGNPGVRAAAVHAIHSISPGDESYREQWKRLKVDEDAEVAQAAARALESIGESPNKSSEPESESEP